MHTFSTALCIKPRGEILRYTSTYTSTFEIFNHFLQGEVFFQENWSRRLLQHPPLPVKEEIVDLYPTDAWILSSSSSFILTVQPVQHKWFIITGIGIGDSVFNVNQVGQRAEG